MAEAAEGGVGVRNGENGGDEMGEGGAGEGVLRAVGGEGVEEGEGEEAVGGL